jgi:pimeloyl-ACP methyl ester carboxylesterase
LDQRIAFARAKDKTTIAYALSGEGPPLVRAGTWLTHVHHDWDSPFLGHWLRFMSERHTLVRYDPRGCGLSQTDVGSFTFDDWVADLEAVVDRLELQSFPLFGMSQGAAVAAEYAIRHPERVSHLTLYAPLVTGWRNRPSPSAQQWQLMEQLVLTGWGEDNMAFPSMFAHLFVPHSPPETRQWYAELQRKMASKEVASRFMGVLAELKMFKRLKEVRVPTLVIQIAHDQVVDPRSAPGIAGEIPGSEFVSIDSSNHILLEDEPGWQEFKNVFRRHVPGSATPGAARCCRARKNRAAVEARAEDSRRDRQGPEQSRDRCGFVHQREDGAQSHHQHLRQARSVIASAGHRAGEGIGLVGRLRDMCPGRVPAKLGPQSHECPPPIHHPGPMDIRTDSARYSKCLHNAQKVTWDIDADVIRFRQLDTGSKFLPDSLSLVTQLAFLNGSQQVLLSQVQGRTYAYLFGLIERCINAKMLERARAHCLGDQTAVAALLKFVQEELKHQELFRRIEKLADIALPAGYRMTTDPDAAAAAMLRKSNWAVLALTCFVEIFTQAHYLHSIRDDDDLSPLFRDVFYYHWIEEVQHATLDEMEWQRVHDELQPAAIDTAIDDFIELLAMVDGILQAQASADGEYFCHCADAYLSREHCNAVKAGLLKAYRLQYLVSGARIERFQRALSTKLTPEQMQRVDAAFAPLIGYVGSPE